MLDTLAARSPEPLVARLERRPGERDVRWVATFGEPFDSAALEQLAADEIDDSTADLPRPARTVADGFRFDVPTASSRPPPRSTPQAAPSFAARPTAGGRVPRPPQCPEPTTSLPSRLASRSWAPSSGPSRPASTGSSATSASATR